MAIANPEVDYVKERLELRSLYIKSPPQSRLNVIWKRFSYSELGATRLITVVSGVEALARSMVVHGKAKSEADIEQKYLTFKDRNPDALVEDVLKLYRQPIASSYFQGDTWRLFRESVNYRNQVVHECTFLGQDKYPSLIAATLEVFEALIDIGGLVRPRESNRPRSG